MATGWKTSYYRYRELFLNVSDLYKKRADLRAFLEIVLSIVAVIVFSLFALKPTALTIIDLLQQIKEKNQTLLILNKKIGNLEKANAILTQNTIYLDNINLAISSGPSPDIFTKQIQALSAKHGIELVGLTINDIVLVGTPKTGRSSGDVKPFPENANEMSYSASIRGGFVNISSFLKELENLRIISKIDSLTISSSVSDTGRVIVAVVAGRIPYLGSEK
jgi:hypothetical protein